MQYYFGNDLGADYSSSATVFRLWAPSADAVSLCLYEAGDGDCLRELVPMQRDCGGTWRTVREGDLDGTYYTYQVWHNKTMSETQDPYSVAVGVNGRRSMVLNLRATDPEGFDRDCGPRLQSPADLVVCEVSVADTTTDASCGCDYPGRFLGLAQTGLRTAKGVPVGLDHLRELGITHVQLMPIFDFASIDEARTREPQYNWGYDPLNYNVPEGSYSTDPFHGQVRVRECKQMVQALHAAGLGVIMDVVYNHVFDAEQSCFYKAEPDWFFRKKGDAYSNASACGNEVASEHPMARRYIVDSLCHWVQEYHIDGFRFDLMGVLDIDTMNEISDRLHEINPHIILYGEGWTGGESVLPEYRRALKKNVRMLRGIGMFSDDIRDTIRGHVFYENENGFVSGRTDMENSVRYAVTAGVWHPQVDYSAYRYTPGGPWAQEPTQAISYVSCHDNLTLWDKLSLSCPDAGRGVRLAMNRLAAAIVFTSQGIPFFLQGEEWGRSKPIEGSGRVAENSYNLPLYTNRLRCPVKRDELQLAAYYRGLIAFRKAHEGLRLRTAEQVRTCIRFLEDTPPGVVAYVIDFAKEVLFIAYNANGRQKTLPLPEGRWERYVDKERAGTEVLAVETNCLLIKGISCCALVKRNGEGDPASVTLSSC